MRIDQRKDKRKKNQERKKDQVVAVGDQPMFESIVTFAAASRFCHPSLCRTPTRMHNPQSHHRTNTGKAEVGCRGMPPSRRPGRLALLPCCLFFLLLLPRPCRSFSSLCRSSLPDPGAFSNEAQCNDKGIEEHQYCLPENWGLQCGVSRLRESLS